MTKKQQKYLVFSLCIANISFGWAYILPGAALPLILAHTHTTNEILGLAYTAGSIGFILASLLAGLLQKWIKPELLFILSLLMSGIAIAGIFTTDSVILVAVFQLCIGAATAGINYAINLLGILHFGDRLNATLTFVHATFGIGALLSPLALSGSLFLWHDSLVTVIIGLVFLCTTISFFFFISRQVSRQVIATPPLLPVEPTKASETSKALKHPYFWFMLAMMFISSGCEVGYITWATTALVQAAKVNIAQAAPAASIFYIGLTIGRFLAAYILGKGYISQKRYLNICFIGLAIISTLTVFGASNLWLGFLGVGCFGFFVGPLFPNIMTRGTGAFAKTPGLISSTLLLSSGTSSALHTYVIGLLLQSWGGAWGLLLPALSGAALLVVFWLANRNIPREEDISSPLLSSLEEAPASQA